MNTGIQDAHNLAWKLALAVSGKASATLLDSYDAERRPVGEEVVGRTVRSAREGIGADSNDPTFVGHREAQLLIDGDDSPLIAGPEDVTPFPGTRSRRHWAHPVGGDRSDPAVQRARPRPAHDDRVCRARRQRGGGPHGCRSGRGRGRAR